MPLRFWSQPVGDTLASPKGFDSRPCFSWSLFALLDGKGSEIKLAERATCVAGHCLRKLDVSHSDLFEILIVALGDFDGLHVLYLLGCSLLPSPLGIELPPQIVWAEVERQLS